MTATEVITDLTIQIKPEKVEEIKEEQPDGNSDEIEDESLTLLEQLLVKAEKYTQFLNVSDSPLS